MAGLPYEVVKVLSKPVKIDIRDAFGEIIETIYSVDVHMKLEYEVLASTVSFETYEEAINLKEGKVFYR
jgi:hypothetical protein